MPVCHHDLGESAVSTLQLTAADTYRTYGLRLNLDIIVFFKKKPLRLVIFNLDVDIEKLISI